MLLQIVICSVVSTFILIKRKKWKSKYGLPLFLAIFLPNYIFAWAFIDSLYQSGQIFAPLNIFRIQFFVLAFLVPSSHWINFAMMLAFAVEAAAAWFYFDLPNLERAAMGGEPIGLIITLIISATVLFFRFRDEQIIKALVAKDVRSEVVTQIARTFLTIRDRANTPLQTLLISAAQLKKRHPDDQQLTQVIESNVKTLNNINGLLKSLKHQISWQGKELMSNDEILKWLTELQKHQSE